MKISHTMLRVKKLDASIDFYTNLLQMKILERHDFEKGQFTLVYLGYGPKEEAYLELTYNWDGREYDMGNAYGHICIEVEDVYKTCETLKGKGVNITREPGPLEGSDYVIAFLKDPDGYLIELLQA